MELSIPRPPLLVVVVVARSMLLELDFDLSSVGYLSEFDRCGEFLVIVPSRDPELATPPSVGNVSTLRLLGVSLISFMEADLRGAPMKGAGLMEEGLTVAGGGEVGEEGTSMPTTCALEGAGPADVTGLEVRRGRPPSTEEVLCL